MRRHRLQPNRLLCPWDSPGKNTGMDCHFLLQCMKVKSESEVAQSRLTLHNPIDCSLPGSSMHGILQARVLEWVAISFFSSQTCSVNPSGSPSQGDRHLQTYPDTSGHLGGRVTQQKPMLEAQRMEQTSRDLSSHWVTIPGAKWQARAPTTDICKELGS